MRKKNDENNVKSIEFVAEKNRKKDYKNNNNKNESFFFEIHIFLIPYRKPIRRVDLEFVRQQTTESGKQRMKKKERE